MSLDITLREPEIHECNCKHCNLKGERVILFDCNITHNLNTMATEAGIYEAVWRPYKLHKDWVNTEDYSKEMEFENTHPMYTYDIVHILEKGIKDMKKRPKHYKKFDSSNGWGVYDDFIPWLEKYLQACKDYPNAIINCDR